MWSREEDFHSGTSEESDTSGVSDGSDVVGRAGGSSQSGRSVVRRSTEFTGSSVSPGSALISSERRVDLDVCPVDSECGSKSPVFVFVRAEGRGGDTDRGTSDWKVREKGESDGVLSATNRVVGDRGRGVVLTKTVCDLRSVGGLF